MRWSAILRLLLRVLLSLSTRCKLLVATAAMESLLNHSGRRPPSGRPAIPAAVPAGGGGGLELVFVWCVCVVCVLCWHSGAVLAQ